MDWLRITRLARQVQNHQTWSSSSAWEDVETCSRQLYLCVKRNLGCLDRVWVEGVVDRARIYALWSPSEAWRDGLFDQFQVRATLSFRKHLKLTVAGTLTLLIELQSTWLGLMLDYEPICASMDFQRVNSLHLVQVFSVGLHSFWINTY